MGEQLVGTVTHYYGQAQVAGIELTDGQLQLGDTIHIRGHTSDFTQIVESMQIDHVSVDAAAAGNQIGIQIAGRARVRDHVYRITPD